MDINNQFTYEAIKERILKNASEMWDVPDVHRLDPLVTNLVDIYAAELSRLAEYADGFESSIMPKLSSVAAPLILTAPTPAHTVIQCLPQEDSFFMHRHTMFAYKKQVTDYDAGMGSFFEQLYFSPLGSQTIYNTPVKLMASGFNLYQLDDGGNKTIISSTPKTNHLPPNHVWIGMKVPQRLANLNWLNLYFNWGDTYNEWAYKLMSLIEICNGDQALQHLKGLAYYHSQDAGLSATINMESPEEVYREKVQELKNSYRKRFRTLPRFLLDENRESYPDIFNGHFPNGDLAKLQTPLLWLKLVFPPYYTIDMLEKLSISTTAFPVCNMRYVHASQTITEESGLLPLTVEKGENLLSIDINGVEGDKGGSYTFSTRSIKDINNYNLHFLDNGRFDTRTTTDIATWLQEMTKDEPFAFKQYGLDYISSAVQAITTKLREATVQAVGPQSNSAAYLHINGNIQKDKVKAGYWLTQQTAANGLQRGRHLIQGNGNGIMANSIVTLMPTRGGKAKLALQDREVAFWFHITSGNRLVTNGDIKRYCRFKLGNLISHIEMEQGLVPSHHPNKGYIRCITIKLSASNKTQLTEAEWGWVCSDLLDGIKGLAPSNIDYMVLMNKEV